MISAVSYSKRCFSQSANLSKARYSLKDPVHHLETYKKRILSTTHDRQKIAENDIRSRGYYPLDSRQDRLIDHYYNSVQPDMMLMAYDHAETYTPGPVYVEQHDMTNPYTINSTKRTIFGKTGQFLNRYPMTPKNIPELLDLQVVCVAKDINENKYNYVSAKSLIQQTTNVKPQDLKVAVADPKLHLGVGTAIGGQATLNGYEKNQFLLTINELVYPKDENFVGIPEHTIDTKGNLTLHLTAQHVASFPEVMSDKDLWNSLFNMMVHVKTSAQDPAYAKMLLSGLGFPFVTLKPIKEPKRV